MSGEPGNPPGGSSWLNWITFSSKDIWWISAAVGVIAIFPTVLNSAFEIPEENHFLVVQKAKKFPECFKLLQEYEKLKKEHSFPQLTASEAAKLEFDTVRDCVLKHEQLLERQERAILSALKKK
eukprot:TRINITY_DN2504_c0_g1_i1.p1 TRINITY_DN2504_c0_g1~~TRINITY_DN2504_c0_g1_i1.p1  ORF type:complete len:124 (+),score=23.74 TRINITY_DN2504_c0_g1_i1:68-439(+)